VFRPLELHGNKIAHDTAQLHHDNLRVTLRAAGLKWPSYPSVRRYLKAEGLLRRRPPKRSTDGAVAARERLEQREVRSYEVEHVLQLMRMRSPVICGTTCDRRA